MDGKQLQEQYKNHISDYKDWDQREHAAEWLLYPENAGPYLSIDETSLSNGELYTIVTNKATKGRKGSLLAMVKGTQAASVIEILRKIPKRIRSKVREVTLDMAANMGMIVSRCFPKALKVIDRFHIQKLAYDAVQEVRIKYRWEALDQENQAIEAAKHANLLYQPEILGNGDTLKQLLVRSRYLLFKHYDKWTASQIQRSKLLFELYPLINQAYKLATGLGTIFRTGKSKEQAFKKLALWYNEVEDCRLDSFKTVARSIQTHYLDILNFFNHRSTNASAESFNAKIKAFRSSSRGVRDIPFFLLRLTKLYA
ncbi:transposase [Dyadobacter chenhuakuii]|uniref:Transposase n=1 Tax=Dyadobacter chenhuakuii TaxID=2909339 RepID=A0ABY4XTE8_9BACT|nr:transposase [Dyadobacter chenhuakuii]MCF2495834.1 transposase [Dyadobacter chenhuakuii]USJ33599.1 transposase [Dyadobacter chenhuakuii]